MTIKDLGYMIFGLIISNNQLQKSLSVLSLADINSEEEMLGYGVGIILLNGMMYV